MASVSGTSWYAHTLTSSAVRDLAVVVCDGPKKVWMAELIAARISTEQDIFKFKKYSV